MKDVFRLPESPCARARDLLPRSVDDDLSLEHSVWLRGHLDACPHCRAAHSRLQSIDTDLLAWGRQADRRNPSPPHAREQFVATLESLPSAPRPGSVS